MTLVRENKNKSEVDHMASYTSGDLVIIIGAIITGLTTLATTVISAISLARTKRLEIVAHETAIAISTVEQQTNSHLSHLDTKLTERDAQLAERDVKLATAVTELKTVSDKHSELTTKIADTMLVTAHTQNHVAVAQTTPLPCPVEEASVIIKP